MLGNCNTNLLKFTNMVKNIVLLHGWGARVVKLFPLQNELRKLGWNVYVPKLPGFGLKPPKRPWVVDDYVNFVTRKADERFGSKKYIIFGHSFGGRIAIKVGVERNDTISGLVLCATGGISRESIIKRVVFGSLAKIGKPFMQIPLIGATIRKLFYIIVGEHDYEKTSGVMRKTFRNVVSEDLKPLINKIKYPVLILWGKEDRITPFSDAKVITSKLSGAKLKTFNNQGHQLPYNLPEKLAQEINKWI